MGYSFSDINIRVIWFKLMDMMKDIPIHERPTSFILRLNPNPALQKLYEEVGIKTIVLDPDNKATSFEQRAGLLNDFMFTIASLASPNCKILGQSEKKQFFSLALSNLILSELDNVEKGRSPGFGRIRSRRVPLSVSDMIEIAGKRTIPTMLQEEARRVLEKCVSLNKKSQGSDYLSMISPMAVTYSNIFGIDPLTTFIVSMGLGRSSVRDALLKDSVPWKNIWAAQLNASQAEGIISRFEHEVSAHEEGNAYAIDRDLAYLADPVLRILRGDIFDNENEKIVDEGQAAIQRASKMYPSISKYTPSTDQPPSPLEIISEIDERRATIEPDEPPSDDDVPF